MKPPLCPVCNERHQLRDPHVCADIAPSEPSANAVTHAPVTHDVTHAAPAVVTHASTSSPARRSRYRARHGDAYRRRHAAYMQTWRAVRHTPRHLHAT